MVVPSAVIVNVFPLVISVSPNVVAPLSVYVTFCTPEVASVPAVTFTATSLVYQLPDNVPLLTATVGAVGSVLSFVTVNVPAADLFPALS